MVFALNASKNNELNWGLRNEMAQKCMVPS